MWLLKSVMLLALIVWIGGIVFFAFVLAPTLFTVLAPALAASVVAPTLGKLHWIGLISGTLFIACSLIYNWRRYSQFRLFSATHILVALMLILTAVSQFAITPRMRQLRRESVPTLDAQAEFGRLHTWSTRLEGGVLMMGLVAVVLMGRGRSGL